MIDDDLLRLMATEAGMAPFGPAVFVADVDDLRAFAEAAGRGALTAAYFASSSLECAAALRARINAPPELHAEQGSDSGHVIGDPVRGRGIRIPPRDADKKGDNDE